MSSVSAAIAAKREQLERASEGIATLEGQRDALSNQLREQVAENAELRRRLEQLQAVAAANQSRDAELKTLADLAHETTLQLSNKLGG